MPCSPGDSDATLVSKDGTDTPAGRWSPYPLPAAAEAEEGAHQLSDWRQLHGFELRKPEPGWACGGGGVVQAQVSFSLLPSAVETGGGGGGECNGLLFHVSADFGKADAGGADTGAGAGAPLLPPRRRAVLLLEPFRLAVEARNDGGGCIARTARLTVLHNGMRVWARPPPPPPPPPPPSGRSARYSPCRRVSRRKRLRFLSTCSWYARPLSAVCRATVCLSACASCIFCARLRVGSGAGEEEDDGEEDEEEGASDSGSHSGSDSTGSHSSSEPSRSTSYSSSCPNSTSKQLPLVSPVTWPE